LADAPAAFADARERAAAWGLSRRLRRLEARYRRAPRRGWPPPYLRRPRRGAVIAFSGLDGAGKSTQAEALRSSLVALGYDASILWAPIGQNVWLRRFARVIKRGLSHLPVGPLAGGDDHTPDDHMLSRTEPGTPAFGSARKAAAHAWSTVTTLANALALRRAAGGTRVGGRIVIYDRYVLDTVVELRFRYSPDARMRYQELLVRVLAPKALQAYLLDLPPDVAHERKPDWSRDQTRLRADLYRRALADLGVISLDAARPAHEIAQEVLRDVLRSLRC
jgi:thymidylate kinase